MLIYILIGAIFATVGITILGSLSDLLATAVEMLRAKMAVKINKYNIEINKLSEEPTRAIGF